MKSGDVICNSIDCIMSLLFITTTFSLCSLFLTSLYLLDNASEHLDCPKYSSLSQILHNYITLSVFCDNMYKHTHSSWIHQVFSFSFHHQQCLCQNESVSDL